MGIKKVFAPFLVLRLGTRFGAHTLLKQELMKRLIDIVGSLLRENRGFLSAWEPLIYWGSDQLPLCSSPSSEQSSRSRHTGIGKRGSKIPVSRDCRLGDRQNLDGSHILLNRQIEHVNLTKERSIWAIGDAERSSV
jgi:hypothetical protein